MTNKNDFDRIILAAPLIHSVLWNTSKIGYKLLSPFIKQVVRVFRRNSSDNDFLHFVKYQDPLQARKLPLRWTNALYNWNDKIVNAEVSDKSILIIQGKADATVDYKFNLRFLKLKFPDTQIKLLENARHELFNERREIRQEVFRCIKNWLDK
jgi:alpha-beta hydrolase superfamily lysophospholipase